MFWSSLFPQQHLMKLMGAKLLTGVPRSGTTLCCYLLNQYRNTVALHEPISSGSFSESREDAVELITKFAHSAHSQLLKNKSIVTKQRNGKIPNNPVSGEVGVLRKEAVALGVIKIKKDLDKEFTLFVKHNALFAALLEDLIELFDVYAVVRNPMSVLVSWQTVDLPVHFGRLPMGEKFDKKLSFQLRTTESVLEKQLLVLGWFYKRFNDFINPSRIIRYEDVISSQGRSLHNVVKNTANRLQFDQEKPASGLSVDHLRVLRNALISHESFAVPFYSSSEIDAEYYRILE